MNSAQWLAHQAWKAVKLFFGFSVLWTLFCFVWFYGNLEGSYWRLALRLIGQEGSTP